MGKILPTLQVAEEHSPMVQRAIMMLEVVVESDEVDSNGGFDAPSTLSGGSQAFLG